MSRILILLLSVLILPVHSAAQQSKCTISGHIADEQNTPVAYASVAVYDDDKPIAGTITDDHGKFTLKAPVNIDGYELAVEFIGYTRYTCAISAGKPNVDLGTITLKENTIALEGAMTASVLLTDVFNTVTYLT